MLGFLFKFNSMYVGSWEISSDKHYFLNPRRKQKSLKYFDNIEEVYILILTHRTQSTLLSLIA